MLCYFTVVIVFIRHKILYIIQLKINVFTILFVEHTENEGARQNTEQRIDLIKFYNTIFVQIVRDNALKYSTNSGVSYP